MPHDKNGKLVEIGDIVMGRGYNLKHDIIGPVIDVNSAESCNLTVGIAKFVPIGKAMGLQGLIVSQAIPRETSMSGELKQNLLTIQIEYGATKDFEIIQKADGTDAI